MTDSDLAKVITSTTISPNFSEKSTFGCFQKLGVSQNGWFRMENPIKENPIGTMIFWKHPFPKLPFTIGNVTCKKSTCPNSDLYFSFATRFSEIRTCLALLHFPPKVCPSFREEQFLRHLSNTEMLLKSCLHHSSNPCSGDLCPNILHLIRRKCIHSSNKSKSDTLPLQPLIVPNNIKSCQVQLVHVEV